MSIRPVTNKCWQVSSSKFMGQVTSRVAPSRFRSNDKRPGWSLL
jgi:hypothetical protein